MLSFEDGKAPPDKSQPAPAVGSLPPVLCKGAGGRSGREGLGGSDGVMKVDARMMATEVPRRRQITLERTP